MNPNDIDTSGWKSTIIATIVLAGVGILAIIGALGWGIYMIVSHIHWS